MRGGYLDFGALSGTVYELCVLYGAHGDSYLNALNADPKAVAKRLREIAATMNEEHTDAR